MLEFLWVIHHKQYKTLSGASGDGPVKEIEGDTHDCEKEPLNESLNNTER